MKRIKFINRITLFTVLLPFLSCKKPLVNNDSSSGTQKQVGSTPDKHPGIKFSYVGACNSFYPRLTHVPGRVYQDFNNQPVDASVFFSENGFNCVRVFVTLNQKLMTSSYDNTNVDHREANYQLDIGGEDLQVNLAAQAKQLNQKIILTINMPTTIPSNWDNLTYEETVVKIDSSTRALLKPFISAGIQPDIINICNEAEGGILFNDGTNSRSTDAYALNTSATGSSSIWPKCAGYFKDMIIASKDEMKKAGMDLSRTRFSVHGSSSAYHATYFADLIFANKPDAEQVYYKNGVAQGTVTAIPEWLRNCNLKDLVDVFCESVYPPKPTENSASAYDASLSRYKSDFDHIIPELHGFGKFTNGPFSGQYSKQFLVLEFAMPTDNSFTVSNEQTFVGTFFSLLSQYDGVLGALWWEPTYARNNFDAGTGSLYRTTTWNSNTQTYDVFKPISTITTWGSYAVSH